MIPIKDYYCDSTPTEQELYEGFEIAKKEKCVVHLKWFVQYDGWYDRYIHENTDIKEMNNQLKHIIYGM